MHSACRGPLIIAVALLAKSAMAQKPGGTLRLPLRENPGSASPLEESSIKLDLAAFWTGHTNIS